MSNSKHALNIPNNTTPPEIDEFGELIDPLILPPTLKECGVVSPLNEWVETLYDEWLENKIRRLIETGEPWDHIVALGMLAKIWKPTSPELTNEILSYTGPEIAHPIFFRVEKWAKSMPSETCQALERLAIAEAGMLSDILEEIIRKKPESEGWISQAESLIHRRDDLDGVEVILRNAGGGKTLKHVVATLDELGWQWVESLHKWPLPDDEGLTRLSWYYPNLWWVEQASE